MAHGRFYMKRKVLKKTFLLLLICTIFLPPAAIAEQPVSLSHTLTAYNKTDDSITLNFSLHVKNTGDKKIYKLVLSHIPLSIISTKEVSLDIGTLKSQGSADVIFTLLTPMVLTEQEISKHPLLWAVKYIDSSDNPIEFSAESRGQ